jgi:hypothetical protein
MMISPCEGELHRYPITDGGVISRVCILCSEERDPERMMIERDRGLTAVSEYYVDPITTEVRKVIVIRRMDA